MRRRDQLQALAVGLIAVGWLSLGCTKRPVVAVSEEPAVVAMGKADPALWRCRDGQCRRRAREASPFVCIGDDCTQRWPRLPDANEWDCQAGQGPVLCRFHAPSAGLGVTVVNDDFVCGVRRGHANERLCVDFDPDVPPGAGPWSCRFDEKQRKVCVPATAAPRPLHRGSPDCWMDDDCDGGSSPCLAGRCAPR